MCGQKQEGTWIQCTNCGKIYYIECKVPMEQVYVTSYCPGCEHDRGLVLGSEKDDCYAMYDVTLDGRYY